MKLYEYIQQGGPIMYLLLFVNIIGWSLMLSKFYFINAEIKSADGTSGDLSKELLNDGGQHDTATLIELAKQICANYILKVEKGLNTVKIIATISPLLGLLGTVIGVLSAFHVMSQTGLSDPSNFAKGISMALVTTVGGMIVAIPHFVGHNYLLGMLDKLEASLEKSVIEKVL